MVTHISFTCDKNVVGFCDKRLDSLEVDKIIKAGKGLSNTDALDKELEQSNYIPVLKAVWSERDKSRRLEWLKNKLPQLHVPLMYELAIAEFVASPKIETLIQVSMPLIRAASFRVRQDSKCSQDISVSDGDIIERMEDVYKECLVRQVKKHLNTTLQTIFLEYETSCKAAIDLKVREVATLSLTQLPFPDWVGWHGMGAFMGRIEMHPKEKYKEIRDRIAHEKISSLKA